HQSYWWCLKQRRPTWSCGMSPTDGQGRRVSRTLPLPQARAASAANPADLPIAILSELTGEKKEKCGIFGIAGPADAVERCYYGIYALQHRGQESAGIAASDGMVINAHTGLGLVADVFKKDVIKEMTGGAGGVGASTRANGHVGYS